MVGDGASKNYLDSCRAHLLVWSPIMISILVGDACQLGPLLCSLFLKGKFAYWDEVFQLGRALDMRLTYVGSTHVWTADEKNIVLPQDVIKIISKP